MALHPHHKASRLETLQRLCRDRGIPLTVQRRVIFEAVLDHRDHPTAEQIFEDVRGRLHAVSRTTVYRVLETLVQLGVIGKPSCPGSVARYDKSVDRHHHLVCTRCERTMDLDDSSLNRLRIPDTRRMGFVIADYSVHFTGVCQACRRNLSPATERSAKRRGGARGRRRAR